MIVKIKNKLRNSEDLIREILDEIGCENIHKISEVQFRFGLNDEGSGSGNSLFIDTLNYKSFSRDTSGDIITLVKDMKGISLGDSIRLLANRLNIKATYNPTNITLPFGGFWKGLSKTKDIDDSPPLIYPIETLAQYNYGSSLLWIKDEVSALTQELYNIGYDFLTDRITIPWFNEVGELCGIVGRLNRMNIGEKECKYLSLIPFNKSKCLYGFYENYQDILTNDCVIVVESEKSVLKGREKGYKNIVAIGGNSISPRQAGLLKSMFCKVILVLDEDMTLQHCVEQASKVQVKNPFFENDVYIVDYNNELINDKKVSLLDLDKRIIDEVLEEHLIYIDKKESINE
jgi:hypothetical protein